jgi:hypothetical protein
VYRGGHFSLGAQQTLDKGILVSLEQQQAWDAVIHALEDDLEVDLDVMELPVQRLALAMLTVDHGPRRFSLSIVSFIAMLSL